MGITCSSPPFTVSRRSAPNSASITAQEVAISICRSYARADDSAHLHGSTQHTSRTPHGMTGRLRTVDSALGPASQGGSCLKETSYHHHWNIPTRLPQLLLPPCRISVVHDEHVPEIECTARRATIPYTGNLEELEPKCSHQHHHRRETA